MDTAPDTDLTQPPPSINSTNSDASPKESDEVPDTEVTDSNDTAQRATTSRENEPGESPQVEAPSESTKMDFILYSGDVRRGADLEFIEFISKEQSSTGITLVLCTHGGNPDAAYKIGRFIQSVYDSFKLLIPGHCKSAGTLLAIAAQEIIFSPYGELGPLDVQMARTDIIAGLESGLNIGEAFWMLEDRASTTFHDLIADITNMSNGIVSFQTASRSATEFVSALYGPVFAQIEPEDVGSRSRAMRIGEDYGMRLNQEFSNLLPSALRRLSRSYASHSFVIDHREAAALFKNVRTSTEVERALTQEVGERCFVPDPSPSAEPIIKNITETYEKLLTIEATSEDRDE